MKILAIETSCDETAVAVLSGTKHSDNHARFELLGNVTLSQIEKHREFGGVYPNVARREHALHIVECLQLVCTEAGMNGEESEPNFSEDKITQVSQWLEREPELQRDLIQFAWSYRNQARGQIDAICVTAGPGLAPALWIGVNVVRSLAELWEMPLVPVNHMAGHVLSGLWPDHDLQTPSLALLVSGGHTEINLVTSAVDFKRLGKTVDDAAGEAFDKVARMLDLPYPGGPEISKLATMHRKNNPEWQSAYNLPLPMEHSGDLNFSFSGLKTAVKKVISDDSFQKQNHTQILAREFEDVVVGIIIKKLATAIDQHYPQSILAGGGVVANQYLRKSLDTLCQEKNLDLYLSATELTGDNAIMIGMSGFWQFINSHAINSDDLKAVSNWPVDQGYQEI